MPRYSSPKATPGQPTFEGDQEYIAMDLETKPWLLPTGHYADGRNARCADGALTKRCGTLKPFWANFNGFPGGILGAAIYNNPNSDTKLMVIATPTDVWKIASGGIPTSIGLPEGVALAGRVEFAQHFDKLQLHQSGGRPSYQWDGNPAHRFAALAQVHPTANNKLVPASEWSVPFSGRSLFPIPDARDRFGVSDFEDYGSWDDKTRNYRANAGTADSLVALVPYLTGNLIIAKRGSLDVFKNFRGDLSQLSAEVVSATVGLVARKGWQMIGPDALFPSRQGVFRLSQVDQNRLAASPIPVAASKTESGRVIDPTAPLWRRINWQYADRMVSGLDGPYYVLAFPIDGSPVNNCLAWLNTVSEKWEGYDLYDPRGRMQIDELLSFEYNGELRLYAVNFARRTIHLLNEGVEDELDGGRYEIQSDFLTRGFATLGWNAAPKRDFKRVVITIRSSRPSLTVEEITDQARDNRPLTRNPITRDRTRYVRFGRRPYDPSNVNDDALASGREDYSVVLEEGDQLHLGSGVPIGQKQESTLGGPGGFSTRCRGRFIQYRIQSTQGELDVLGCLVESEGVQREVRKAG